MSNKETLQGYNERLGINNTNLDELLNTIRDLPENVDDELIASYLSMVDDSMGANVTKLPGGITKIGTKAFSGKTNISSKLKIPNTVTEIGERAFDGCSNLETLDLPDSITTIGPTAFGWCSKINFTKLPPNLTTIDGGAFNECNKLVLEGGLPEGLTLLGNNAFYDCDLLNIKTIPDSVTVIPQECFRRCFAIKQISMRNVKSIFASWANGGSFTQCTALKAVWIGSAIESLQGYGFCNTFSMKKFFIDLPRATVEAMPGYSLTFSNNAFTADKIVCNDDEGFITKEEFDAIDWESYTEE